MTPEEFPAYVVGLVEAEPTNEGKASVANTWHEAAQKAIRDVARIRRVAVREMYKSGHTYEEIGAALGITRGRAHQLARGRTR